MGIRLRKADGLEIIALVDNYCDELLDDTPVAKRFRAPSPLGMMGEPGFSLLVTVFKGKTAHTLLLDGGMSGTCLMHNLSLLSKGKQAVTGRAEKVDAIVLSHGHSDHFKGLESFLERNQDKIPLILHPFAGVHRRYQPDPGSSSFSIHEMARPDMDAFERAGAMVEKRPGPSTMVSDLVMVTGRIKRQTDFESGTPGLQARIGGLWEADPFYDDQAIVVHVRDKGLVVLSGCSHAGIINTVTYAKQITGVDSLHGVMGGFHLPGSASSSLARKTIAEMKNLDPDYIVPMHCTGWNAINAFALEMPEQFILNSVGTAYFFGETGEQKNTPNPKAMESC